MPRADDTIREIAKVLRRHVEKRTLERIVNDLLDVPGDRSFRDAIEQIAQKVRDTAALNSKLTLPCSNPNVLSER